MEKKVYKKSYVNVTLLDDESNLNCLVYERCNEKEPLDLPSQAYKNVILYGAIEVGLPHEYIQFLEKIKTNDYDGPIKIDLPEEIIKLHLKK